MNFEHFIDHLLNEILRDERNNSGALPEGKSTESLDRSHLQGERYMVRLSTQLAPKTFTSRNVKAYQQFRRDIPKGLGPSLKSPQNNEKSAFQDEKADSSFETTDIYHAKYGVEELLCLQQLLNLGAHELSEKSSLSDLKKSFKRLAKIYHPDTKLTQKEKDLSTEYFQRLSLCFQKLLKFTILNSSRS